MDRYGTDVLSGDWKAPKRGRAVEAAADLGLVVEEVTTDWCGEIVAVDRDLDTLTLEDRRGKRRTFGNLAGHIKGMENVTQLGQWTNSQFDTSLNWKDLDWIRSIWPGKLIIKGILDIEDAREAVKTGAQALVVSNHGGRQLDGAQSSIEVLPEIVAAVGDQIEIMFDGGIRSGQDVMRALALGAKSCMIGRAYAHGLGAYGEAGVAKAIDIIRNEMLVTMGLCGVNTVAEIDEHILAG